MADIQRAEMTMSDEKSIERALPRDERAVQSLVDRFLAWPLPKSVRSDMCVTMDYDFPRSGTNLLNADEAAQMIRHLFDKKTVAALAEAILAEDGARDALRRFKESTAGEPRPEGTPNSPATPQEVRRATIEECAKVPTVHSQWQPIASAPKDGAAIILASWGGSSDGDLFPWWIEESEWLIDGRNEGWHLTGERRKTIERFPPTHWMPLPAPPGKENTVGEPRPEGTSISPPDVRRETIEECAKVAEQWLCDDGWDESAHKVATAIRALSRD